MKFYLWCFFMFCMILYAHVAKTPVAERPVRYEFIEDPKQDSIDSAYWRNKSDSLNLTQLQTKQK